MKKQRTLRSSSAKRCGGTKPGRPAWVGPIVFVALVGAAALVGSQLASQEIPVRSKPLPVLALEMPTPVLLRQEEVSARLGEREQRMSLRIEAKRNVQLVRPRSYQLPNTTALDAKLEATRAARLAEDVVNAAPVDEVVE